VKILGISGSLRRESHNRRLLLEAAELLPLGTELELYSELKEVPPYDEDDDGEEADPVVQRLRDAVARADGS
jgi:chromate reductase, NAD(P)H dehydrogenase (quinone)